MKVEIQRVDYKNPTKTGGLKRLSNLTSLDEIEDINEIDKIVFAYDSDADTKELLSKFSNSDNVQQGLGSLDGKHFELNTLLYADFKTFYVTGERKEAESIRRESIINILKEEANNDS